MKYFDMSKTTDEVVRYVRSVKVYKSPLEFSAFMDECERIDSYSEEIANRFFKIIYEFMNFGLSKGQLHRLLTLIENILVREQTISQLFFNNEHNKGTYFALLDDYIFLSNDYLEVKKFIEDGSTFSKILNNEESLFENQTIFSILSVFDTLLRFLNVPEFDKENFTSRVKIFVQKLLNSEYDIDGVELSLLLSLHRNISILDVEELVYINTLVEKNIDFSTLFSHDYLYYINELGLESIQQSQKVLQYLYERTDSDIIKSQIIELLDSTNLPNSEHLSKEEIVKQIKRTIDEIRSALMIDAKKLKDNDFYGHYTKIDTLVNFLFIPETKENVKRPTYLRLSNANQMNDPMEGKALLAVLGLDVHIEQCYKSTNVFLSSLTVVKDSLPMWKEYAEESKGAFLEYDRYYLETIVNHKAIEFAKVHYITTDEKQNIIGDDVVDEKLKYIKDNIEHLEEKGAYEEILGIIDYIAKISYLFKVSDYQYESEYRILVNLDDTYFTSKFTDKLNSEKVSLINGEEISKEVFEKYIKDETAVRKLDASIGLLEAENVNYTDIRKYIHIEKSGPRKCNLYVYINVAPLRYSKIMLGPKVENVDYIAPYIHYIQPDIIVETSSIPYR
ncbi:DUF2971 domain-containing protein [Streptococcus suis]|nr:DUF2971 domain-containing protein [Streptococcus suis]NQJ76283.1 DUF2971 domain-containing protein [Streptococcus suis]